MTIDSTDLVNITKIFSDIYPVNMTYRFSHVDPVEMTNIFSHIGLVWLLCS